VAQTQEAQVAILSFHFSVINLIMSLKIAGLLLNDHCQHCHKADFKKKAGHLIKSSVIKAIYNGRIIYYFFT